MKLLSRNEINESVCPAFCYKKLDKINDLCIDRDLGNISELAKK